MEGPHRGEAAGYQEHDEEGNDDPVGQRRDDTGVGASERPSTIRSANTLPMRGPETRAPTRKRPLGSPANALGHWVDEDLPDDGEEAPAAECRCQRIEMGGSHDHDPPRRALLSPPRSRRVLANDAGTREPPMLESVAICGCRLGAGNGRVLKKLRASAQIVLVACRV